MERKAASDLPTLQQLKNELERETYKRQYGKTLRSTLCVLVVVAAIAVLLATRLFPVYRIYGTSMNPTLVEGDAILTVKGAALNTGDVVALSTDNKILVKRVIAGPGQWVDIDAEGTVYVDGRVIEEPYVKMKAYGDCTTEFPCQVPDGKYFVMGDNRTVSLDSRSELIGCIDGEQIVGRAAVRIWPVKAIGPIGANS